MTSQYSESDVTKELGGVGIFILPDAASVICESDDTTKIIDKIKNSYDSGVTIDVEKANNITENFYKSENTNETTIDEIDENETSGSKRKDKEDKENDKIDKPTDMGVSTSNNDNDNNIKNNEMTNISGGNYIDPENALDEIMSNEKAVKEKSKFLNRKDTLNDRHPELCDIMFNRELSEPQDRLYNELNYKIKGDITGESRGEGKFSDYRELFENRFNKMFSLLSDRVGRLYRICDIDPRRHGGEGLTVAGIVNSTFVSDNDNYFIDLEDPDTNEILRVGWTDDSIKEVFEDIVTDEVIAVRGNLSEPDRKGKDIGLSDVIIWGDDETRRGRPPIMFPDVPRKKSKKKPSQNIEVAMIGDIHIGANEFYPRYWNKFVDWIRENPQVRYIFVVGDIVEGVGVYPDQKEELDIIDIYDQYAMAGRMFDQIPDDVQIFATVGNHDAVRLAEPQPTLDEEFRKYFSDNVEFVGNPVNINLGGVEFLMYHGMSINAISEAIPGLDPEDPIPIMEHMLKKRHVAPIYGKNVRLAPETEDYLVIDDPPDVLHCGHVHKYGQGSYNGVKMINTATWQGQTSFQKSKGIDPEVGYWSVINLSTLEIEKFVSKNM